MASQPPSEFPQIFFRGTVTPEGIPITEQRTVHNEIERTRALAEGWTHDQRNAVESSLQKKLEYHEQQHRELQAARRRQDESLEQTVIMLRRRLEATPQEVYGAHIGHADATPSPGPELSLGQQLKTFMNKVPISIRDFSAATARPGRTAIHSRTIERHLNDEPMGPASVRRYQETLSELLGEKITFVRPIPAPRRRRTGKKPAKHR